MENVLCMFAFYCHVEGIVTIVGPYVYAHANRIGGDSV